MKFSLLERFRQWRTNPEHIATIDAAQAAPPPSPFAPVDLTDPAQVSGVMDIAARIGDILLSSGTSNRDTRTQIHAVTAAYGLVWCHVDITVNNITLFAHVGTQSRHPVTVFRVVNSMTTDFSRLARVDRLIRLIQSGETSPAEAERELNKLEISPPLYRARTAIWGWGIMGGAVAIMLGGTWLMGIIAFTTAMMIMGVNIFLSRNGLPYFYQAVFGGIIATIPAALAYLGAMNLSVEIRPSQIVASCIVVLLAGLTLVQSLQDGIMGAPVTASAHFFETILFTGAIVAGVGIGLQMSALMGITMPPLESVAGPNNATIAMRVLFGAIATMGFAFASYAERSAILLSGVAATGGALVYYWTVNSLGIGPVLASTLAAIMIGITGGLLSRRFKIPPLITAISGITPLLPGLSVYRGMYAALSEQMLLGFTNIATALAIACGLAAGVVLGEWTARRVRRPQRFNPYRTFRSTNRASFSFLRTKSRRNRKPGSGV